MSNMRTHAFLSATLRCKNVGILILLQAIVLAPLQAHAQPSARVLRVGVLSPTRSTEPATMQREPFEQGPAGVGVDAREERHH